MISPGMQNNDRKTVFDTLSFRFETFIRDLFALFTSLKQCIHLVSRSYLVSYVNTNKTLILSLLCKRRSSLIFPRSSYFLWSGRLRFILRSFLKLESFRYNKNNGDFFIHYLRKRFGTWYILCSITEFKFIKKFLHAACENCYGKK